ncbi:hypothetical protein D3C77_794770 [compost metagenome]
MQCGLKQPSQLALTKFGDVVERHRTGTFNFQHRAFCADPDMTDQPGHLNRRELAIVGADLDLVLAGR